MRKIVSILAILLVSMTAVFAVGNYNYEKVETFDDFGDPTGTNIIVKNNNHFKANVKLKDGTTSIFLYDFEFIVTEKNTINVNFIFYNENGEYLNFKANNFEFNFRSSAFSGTTSTTGSLSAIDGKNAIVSLDFSLLFKATDFIKGVFSDDLRIVLYERNSNSTISMGKVDTTGFKETLMGENYVEAMKYFNEGDYQNAILSFEKIPISIYTNLKEYDTTKFNLQFVKLGESAQVTLDLFNTPEGKTYLMNPGWFNFQIRGFNEADLLNYGKAVKAYHDNKLVDSLMYLGKCENSAIYSDSGLIEELGKNKDAENQLIEMYNNGNYYEAFISMRALSISYANRDLIKKYFPMFDEYYSFQILLSEGFYAAGNMDGGLLCYNFINTTRPLEFVEDQFNSYGPKNSHFIEKEGEQFFLLDDATLRKYDIKYFGEPAVNSDIPVVGCIIDVKAYNI